MIGALVAAITGAGGASLSSYESIATATGTGSSGTITFSSIPSTFKHLQIRGIASDTDTTQNARIPLSLQFNSDTGSNYARHRLTGTGSTVTAGGNASLTQIILEGGSISTTTAANVGCLIVDILDYGSTSKYKTVRAITGGDANVSSTAYTISINSGLWMSTSAITSISILDYGGTNFATNTTFALYGIKEA